MIIRSKNLNFLFIIYNFKRDRFLHLMTSNTFAHYVILIMTLHNVQCRHRLRSRESKNFSKSQQINYHNFPCDLTKKMNTHTLCFYPLIRKSQAFEILKWAKGSQWRKQRTSNFTREIQLIFSRL